MIRRSQRAALIHRTVSTSANKEGLKYTEKPFSSLIKQWRKIGKLVEMLALLW